MDKAPAAQGELKQQEDAKHYNKGCQGRELSPPLCHPEHTQSTQEW